MRTEGDFIKINEWLMPLSWLYGIGVRIRNWMFDIGMLKSQSYDIPIISVGNITVGGSGKTPHVEYLINLLHDKLKIGVLSRGYKRKSHGYVLAHKDTTMPEIGDDVEIGFNNKYLTDALRVADTDEVNFKLNGPVSPIIILPPEGDSFLFLVLPVRIKTE